MERQAVNAGSGPEKLAAEVKEFAIKVGASLIGIVSASSIDAFPPIWVGWRIQRHTKKTTDVMPDARSVVVMGVHLWDDMLELAIKKGDEWVYPGYLPLDVLQYAMISYLEKRGYNAVPAYSLSCKRLAQLAGFGGYGKNALIVNPEYGPWIRLVPVLTNAEMPADKPFEKDLCGKCENCVKACPASALSPYKVDDTKCLVGVHILGEDPKRNVKLAEFEPQLSRNAHLMCMECQKSCRYGKGKR